MPAPSQPIKQTARRIPLLAIDAAVAARLGPGRVCGNAQPAVFSRQVAMYLAKHVGGWSTTRIGQFYNGRDHSTVCYAVRRIEVLREDNPDVDGLLTVLMDEIRSIQPVTRECTVNLAAAPKVRNLGAVFGEDFLDSLAERIATRLLTKLAPLPVPESAQDSTFN